MSHQFESTNEVKRSSHDEKGLSSSGDFVEDANSSSLSDEECEEKRTYVYRDFSHIKDCPNWDPNNETFRTRFPAKLNAMLSDPALSTILTWMPHGRSWLILDRKLLAEEALPRYFDHSNVDSFLRLVNAWGFRRVLNGIDRNSYYHELFLRGMPHLHARMSRMKSDEMKTPVLKDDQSPRFFDMPPLPEQSTTNQQRAGGNENDSECKAEKVARHAPQHFDASGVSNSSVMNSLPNEVPISLAGTPSESSTFNSAMNAGYISEGVQSNNQPASATQSSQIPSAGWQNQMAPGQPRNIFNGQLCPIVMINPQQPAVFQQSPASIVASPMIAHPISFPMANQSNPTNLPIGSFLVLPAQNVQMPENSNSSSTQPSGSQPPIAQSPPNAQQPPSAIVSTVVNTLQTMLRSNVQLPRPENRSARLIDVLTAHLFVQNQSSVDVLTRDHNDGALETALQLLRSVAEGTPTPQDEKDGG